MENKNSSSTYNTNEDEASYQYNCSLSKFCTNDGCFGFSSLTELNDIFPEKNDYATGDPCSYYINHIEISELTINASVYKGPLNKDLNLTKVFALMAKYSLTQLSFEHFTGIDLNIFTTPIDIYINRWHALNFTFLFRFSQSFNLFYNGELVKLDGSTECCDKTQLIHLYNQTVSSNFFALFKYRLVFNTLHFLDNTNLRTQIYKI